MNSNIIILLFMLIIACNATCPIGYYQESWNIFQGIFVLF